MKLGVAVRALEIAEFAFDCIFVRDRDEQFDRFVSAILTVERRHPYCGQQHDASNDERRDVKRAHDNGIESDREPLGERAEIYFFRRGLILGGNPP